jgi:hypothetical protein
VIDVDLRIAGNPYRLSAWLQASPVAFVSALRGATRMGINLLQQAIRPFTPVRTGLLMGNFRSSVRETPSGAFSKVASDVREGRYVEFGTKEHGEARHMYLKGSLASRESISGIAVYSVRPFIESLGHGA